jgi:hypothetical protein
MYLIYNILEGHSEQKVFSMRKGGRFTVVAEEKLEERKRV